MIWEKSSAKRPLKLGRSVGRSLPVRKSGVPAAMQLDDYYETYNLLATYLVFLDHYFDAPEMSTTRGP